MITSLVFHLIWTCYPLPSWIMFLYVTTRISTYYAACYDYCFWYYNFIYGITYTNIVVLVLCRLIFQNGIGASLKPWCQFLPIEFRQTAACMSLHVTWCELVECSYTGKCPLFPKPQNRGRKWRGFLFYFLECLDSWCVSKIFDSIKAKMTQVKASDSFIVNYYHWAIPSPPNWNSELLLIVIIQKFNLGGLEWLKGLLFPQLRLNDMKKWCNYRLLFWTYIGYIHIGSTL